MGDFEISKTGTLTKYTGSGGNVVIPEGVTAIGSDAFAYCCGLVSISIPASVTRIGEGAFAECDGLTIHTPAGSFAGQYARENGIPVENI